MLCSNTASHLVIVCVRKILAAAAVLMLLFIQPALAAKPKYAAIVVDGNTGKVLHSDSADELRYPASLTKIMTLYILFDYLDKKRITYDTKFYVTPNAAAQPPSKLGLKAGDYIRVYDIIGALVTKSANDAAATVAENIAGGVEKFARLMTSRARALGMTNTVFKNASGLPDPQQVTTARDMARLSMRIMNDFPKYATFFKTRNFSFAGRSHRNHNTLLFTFKGMEGIKTGYTRASGFNLTTSVRRGDKHLIAVVLGGASAKGRNADMSRLLVNALPMATAIPKKRPMEQKIAQLDSQTRAEPTRYTGTSATVSWQQPAPSAPKIAAAPRLVSKGGSAQNAGRSVSKGFDIQIGAYQDRNEAVTKLASVQSAASGLLNGHQPYVMPFEKDGINYHRARFTGFDTREAATNTCAKLKKLNHGCIVMAP